MWRVVEETVLRAGHSIQRGGILQNGLSVEYQLRAIDRGAHVRTIGFGHN